MLQKISEVFNVPTTELTKRGVLDSLVDIDTNLFVDPLLLKQSSIPEINTAHKLLEKHFSKIIKLLSVSKGDDIAWDRAAELLKFEELKGVAIGYGKSSSDGSGIGKKLAATLLTKAKAIIDFGIIDPELFELLGLFAENFGPDRLSDMVLFVIKERIYEYTERVANEVGIGDRITIHSERSYELPSHPNHKKPVLFIPADVLRELPVATSWDDVIRICSFNAQLRFRLNKLVGSLWKGATQSQKKHAIQKYFFANKTAISIFINEYKNYGASSYDFSSDPKLEANWIDKARETAKSNPLKITVSKHPSLENLETIVESLIKQFKKNVELNGLNESFYYSESGVKRHVRERIVQKIFYAISDIYCKANNIDVTGEADAGVGPVDFKYSTGYSHRFLVELKLSSNGHLLTGYEKQIVAYQESEEAKLAAYVVIVVGKHDDKIRQLDAIKTLGESEGKKMPKLIIIDARFKPSASHR